jgi:hypothetical protein
MPFALPACKEGEVIILPLLKCIERGAYPPPGHHILMVPWLLAWGGRAGGARVRSDEPEAYIGGGGG